MFSHKISKKLSFSVLGFTLLPLCGDIPSEQEAEAVTVGLLNLMRVFGETLPLMIFWKLLWASPTERFLLIFLKLWPPLSFLVVHANVNCHVSLDTALVKAVGSISNGIHCF